jgi:hypothetical protein
MDDGDQTLRADLEKERLKLERYQAQRSTQHPRLPPRIADVDFPHQ